MKALLYFPLLFGLMLGVPLSAADTLGDLQQRCAEQERQIQRLEAENSRLRDMLAESGRQAPPPSALAFPANPSAPAPKASAASGTYKVKAGDTLSKIARQQSVTVASLMRVNKLSEKSLLHPGQILELTVAAKPSAPKTEPTAPAATPVPVSIPAEKTSAYKVKAGDTFTSIARRHGTTPAVLMKANPKLDPAKLQIGQSIQIPASQSSATAHPGKRETVSPRPSAPAQSVSQPLVSLTPPTAPDVTVNVVSTAAEPPASLEVIPEYRKTSSWQQIKLKKSMTFRDFALQHGTTTAKLNALNGWNLMPNEILAAGSEINILATP